MVLIHLTDGSHTTLVERLQELVERVTIGEIVGNGLIHQFVAQDGGLTLITVGYLAPDLTEQLLRGLTLKEPGIAVPVVDVVASLTTGAVVHIENQVEPVGLAPAHHRVDACIAVLLARLSHIVFVCEEFIVERQTDGVGTLRGDEVDIGLRYVVVLELLPEFSRDVWSYSLLEQQVDHPGGVRTAEAEHITLRIEPVAEVRALNKQFLTVGLNQVVALNGDEARLALLPATCSAGSE